MNSAHTSTCCTCGHSWPTGTDGSHSCSAVLAKEITSLRYSRDNLQDIVREIAEITRRDQNKETVMQSVRRLADALDGGVGIIAAERRAHFTREGWSPEHDDGHDKGELSAAAASYAMAASGQVRYRRDDMSDITPPSQWPWHPRWWKLALDPVRTLAKAGALIAAEIDRLHRARRG